MTRLTTTWRQHRVVRNACNNNGHQGGLVAASKVTLAQQRTGYLSSCLLLSLTFVETVASPNESYPSRWARPWKPTVVDAGRRRRSRCGYHHRHRWRTHLGNCSAKQNFIASRRRGGNSWPGCQCATSWLATGCSCYHCCCRHGAGTDDRWCRGGRTTRCSSWTRRGGTVPVGKYVSLFHFFLNLDSLFSSPSRRLFHPFFFSSSSKQ